MTIELSSLTFTEQDDIVPQSGVEEVVNTGVANTLAGNDTITSTGTKFNLFGFYTIGAGFYTNGTLNTADGDDIITGIHSPNESEPYPYNPLGAGNIRSYGFFKDRGTIDTGDGNDIITGISEAKRGIGSPNTFYAYGITSSYGSIKTGDGNDTIIGTGTHRGIYTISYTTLDTGKGKDIITGTGSFFGIENLDSTIDTDDGSDIITGIGTHFAGIITLGSINTGDDDDIITGTTSRGSGIENFSYSSIDVGDGNDIITGIGSFYGISNGGTINAGNGKDSIIGESDGTGAGCGISSGGTIDTGNDDDSIISQGIFINYGEVFLGEGNDSIVADRGFPNRALENSNVIDTGDGDDIIASNGVIYNQGIINTGNGNDSIIIDTGVDGTGIGYGIYNNGGTINTGNGNDSIIANGGFQSGLNNSGSVFLGEGEDYIKDFGGGDFYGGNDEDTLELTSGTYTVGIWDTSTTFTKGNQLMITSEFEKLLAGSTIYDFASLTPGQIIVVA